MSRYVDLARATLAVAPSVQGSAQATQKEPVVYAVNAINAVNTRADAALLQYHLALLLEAIHGGCRRGLAQHLERTPSDVVRALLANADRLSLEQWRERCEQAGEAVTLAGLVATYRDRLRQLEVLGGDIFPDAAALEMALLYRPQAEEAR